MQNSRRPTDYPFGSGWDNAMFRVGAELCVRLPRRQAAVELLLNEQRWLPLLADRLPLPIPVPIRIGKPSEDPTHAAMGARTLQAETCLREALTLYRSNLQTRVLDLANALRPLAILLEQTGRAGEAAAAWNETRTLYNSLNLREAVAECDKHLTR